MMDGPASPTSEPYEYGSLPDDIPSELKECIEDCHDKLTIEQLSQLGDYFNKCCSDLRAKASENVTFADFKNAKTEEEEEKVY